MKIHKNVLLTWLKSLQIVYAENKQYLTEYDSAIGDADHGVNLDRGFTQVIVELDKNPPSDISIMLKTVATTLIRNIGGASGPLYGTFFLRASSTCYGKQELEAADIVALWEAGVEGVMQRGKAELKDKTMVDALLPAALAMKEALEQKRDLISMINEGVEAAKKGMEGTVSLQSKKGRSSYLGERSTGHQDPGATSSYLMLRTLAEVISSSQRAL